MSVSPVKMPDTWRVAASRLEEEGQAECTRNWGLCVKRSGLGVGGFSGACVAGSGNPVPWHSLGTRRLWSVPVALACEAGAPPVPGPSQSKLYSEVQVDCLLREAMGKDVGVTQR